MTDGEATDERHLRPSDSRSRFFEALVENALDIITVFDRNGTIQYESPSIERVLGYRPDELVGQNAFSLVHPDDVGRVLQLFTSRIDDPTATASTVFRFRHRDGSWRDMEVTARNLIANPDVNGVLVVAREKLDPASSARQDIGEAQSHAAASLAPRATRADAPTARTTTVLVAEDEPLVRLLVARVLTELGYEVLQADSGEQALSQAAAFGRPIHLLLTDIVMPGIDGRELAERLLKARPGLRVLYMSGYVDRKIVLGDQTDWVGRFLQKPFTAQEMARQVRAALALPGADATSGVERSR